MAVKLFGFTIGREQEEQAQEAVKSFTPPFTDDGAMEIAPGGSYGTYVDLEGTAKSEGELVTRYREMSTQPECDYAIDDVVNESIVMDQDGIVTINLDGTKLTESAKKRIREEFEHLLKLLDFSNKGYDIFRNWYIDGRLYYHIMIDESTPRQGIKELRYIDPRKIRKVREHKKKRDMATPTDAMVHKGFNEYYLYNAKGLSSTNQGLKIAKDSIVHCTSGLMDNRNKMVLSHLHKAIKPLNQLRMLEDATVIYRLARAPERRIFYIDVGNLPKMKAEQYLRDMMVKHKNKLVYDAQTGEVRDDRKFMTMLEDFWLPRREGGKGTEITTLPGGQNLGEMEDVEYFKQKLYKSLNVPVSRLETQGQFNIGRSSEITRDELKFHKFVNRLRTRFSAFFDDLLEIHLALKGITTRREWREMKNEIYFEFTEDNHFSELKDAELLTERLRLLADVDQYVGRYFSSEYVRKNILRQTDDDIEKIDQQIQSEGSDEPDDDLDQQNEEYMPEANVEPFVPNEMTDEDRELIEKMSKILDNQVIEEEPDE